MTAYRSTLPLLKALVLTTVLCFLVAAQNNQAPAQQPKPSKGFAPRQYELRLMVIDRLAKGRLISA